VFMLIVTLRHAAAAARSSSNGRGAL
jgi:hypothetical protein